jgi:hypothetical protein
MSPKWGSTPRLTNRLTVDRNGTLTLTEQTSVLGETSGKDRKPRPGLLCWPSVGAPRHCADLNNQPVDKEKEEEVSSIHRAFLEVLPQLKPNGANVS